MTPLLILKILPRNIANISYTTISSTDSYTIITNSISNYNIDPNTIDTNRNSDTYITITSNITITSTS